jgi:hypothetical protein
MKRRGEKTGELALRRQFAGTYLPSLMIYRSALLVLAI